jgi:hypothetical protein
MTLLAAAFAAWAGVILWFGQAINDRLGTIETTILDVSREVQIFKLSVVERVTRSESMVEQIADLREQIRRIETMGPSTLSPMARQRLEELERRIEEMESHK